SLWCMTSPPSRPEHCRPIWPRCCCCCSLSLSLSLSTRLPFYLFRFSLRVLCLSCYLSLNGLLFLAVAPLIASPRLDSLQSLRQLLQFYDVDRSVGKYLPPVYVSAVALATQSVYLPAI